MPRRTSPALKSNGCWRGHAQSLLSHQIPTGNLPEVFERALDALIANLEKTKFAATAGPRPGR